MSGYSALEFQKAVYTTLESDVTLDGLIDELYNSYIPPNATFPYVLIGDVTATTFDTKTNDGSNVTITIHAFSRGRDQYVVSNILKTLHDILHHANISVADQTLVDLRWDDFSQVFQEDTDNMTTYHGVIRFRALTREV